MAAATVIDRIVSTTRRHFRPPAAATGWLPRNERGLFAIEVDDDGGFRAPTTEVDAASRQHELFRTAVYPVQHVGLNDRDYVNAG